MTIIPVLISLDIFKRLFFGFQTKLEIILERGLLILNVFHGFFDADSHPIFIGHNKRGRIPF